jgi:hypothetical protein
VNVRRGGAALSRRLRLPFARIQRVSKMRIGLHSDKTSFPNLALMKLSAWHKSKGDDVRIYDPLFASQFDKVYSSKVFTFTDEDRELIGNVEKGGTGYKLFNQLPVDIEHTCPDYSLFNLDYSLGFLTRGCPNTCAWCIVPKKEGNIYAHADIEEFLRHDKVVLMDNNVLASPYGLHQIEKLARIDVKVDFNQGLDARLIDDRVAQLLARIKWLSPIRLACDSQSQMSAVFNAVTLLRWHNARPVRYFAYCLVQDVDEAIERVKFLKGLNVTPFAQPFIDYEGGKLPTKRQLEFSRWVNHAAIFNTAEWEDYDVNMRKGRANNGLQATRTAGRGNPSLPFSAVAPGLSVA